MISVNETLEGKKPKCSRRHYHMSKHLVDLKVNNAVELEKTDKGEENKLKVELHNHMPTQRSNIFVEKDPEKVNYRVNYGETEKTKDKSLIGSKNID